MTRKKISRILAAAVALACSPAQAADIGGFINTDTTWTLANSPYVSTSGIIVAENVTLTIEAGVEIKLNSGHSITINGGIVARGNDANKIRFTSNTQDNWAYLHLTDTAIDAIYTQDGQYQSGSIFEHVIIENGAGTAVTNNAALRIQAAYPYMNYMTVQDNADSGVRLWELGVGAINVLNSSFLRNTHYGFVMEDNPIGSRLHFTNLDVSNNGSNGLEIHSSEMTLTVIDSRFENNGGRGFTLNDNGSSGSGSANLNWTIRNNLVQGNSHSGIGGGGLIRWYSAGGSHLSFTDNIIRNNTTTSTSGGLYLFVYSPSATATIENNQFLNNSSSFNTGGVYIYSYVNASISYNIIMGNSSGGSYGGISMLGLYGTTFTHNIILNNSANSVGGAYFAYFSDANDAVSNNIIASNSAATTGGALISSLRSLGFKSFSQNSLVFNGAGSGAGLEFDDLFHSSGEMSNVTANTFSGNHDGTGNAATSLIKAQGDALISGNNFIGIQATSLVRNHNVQGESNIDATGNWWGTTDGNAIENLVWHQLDDAALSQVLYSPYETQINNDLPISPPSGVQASGNVGEITLSWNANPETDTSGYRVYWGSDIMNLDNVMDVGNVTTHTISSLAPGQYTVAVTAYDGDYLLTNDLANTITNDNQTAGNESWYASLVASPTAQPNIQLSASSHDFADQIVNTNSALTVTITNNGTADMTMGILSLVDTDAASFNLSSNSCDLAVIGTGANCSLQVNFSPVDIGAKLAKLQVSSDDPDQSNAFVTLTGNSVAAEASLSMLNSRVDFPNAVVGRNANNRVLSLTNSGTIDLNISNIVISGTNAGDFPLQNGCSSAVIAGAACNITVSFDPASSGSKNASLTFDSNDVNNSSISIPLTGTATEFDPVQITSLSVDNSNGLTPLPVNFTLGVTGGSGNYSYSWDFGDSSTVDTTINPSHSYTTAGSYTVTVTLTDTADSANTTSGQLVVHASDTPALISPVAINAMTASVSSGVAPLATDFMVAASGATSSYTYHWDFGDSSTPATIANPSHSFTTAGSYDVIVTVTDATDTSSTTTGQLTVVVVDPSATYSPVAVNALTADISSGEAPLAINISAAASGGSGSYDYTWDFGDTNNGVGADTSHMFTSVGNYTIVLTATDTADSSNTSTAQLTVKVVAPATEYSPVSISALAIDVSSAIIPFSPTFSVTANGGSDTFNYSWDFGDGATSTVANPSHEYTVAGNYNVTLTVSDSADTTNQTTASLSVTALGVPTIYSPISISGMSASKSAGVVDEFMPVFTVLPSGGSGNYLYAWNFGDGASSIEANPSHIYSTAGVYSVTVTITDNLDSVNTAVGEMIVTAVTQPDNYSPVVINDFSIDMSAGIAPLPVEFSIIASGGMGNGLTYNWNFGDGTTGEGIDPSHTYSSAGTYNVSVTITDSADSSNIANGVMSVLVTDAPEAIGIALTASNDFNGSTLDVSINATITGGNAPYSLLWDFGNGEQISTTTDSNTSTVDYSYSEPGTYTLTVVITSAGGVGATTVTAASGLPVEVNRPASDSGGGGGALGFSGLAVLMLGMAGMRRRRNKIV